MVHSHLVYCLSIYCCANKTSLNRLKVKQKEAIRIICNVSYREHTAPLFAQLKILPWDQLIELSILKFMHSFKHNLLPLSFTKIWQTNRNCLPDRELRNADLLCIPPPPHRFATLKGTVLRDRFRKCWRKLTDLGLNKGRGWFLNFSEAPLIFGWNKTSSFR